MIVQRSSNFMLFRVRRSFSRFPLIILGLSVFLSVFFLSSPHSSVPLSSFSPHVRLSHSLIFRILIHEQGMCYEKMGKEKLAKKIWKFGLTVHHFIPSSLLSPPLFPSPLTPHPSSLIPLPFPLPFLLFGCIIAYTHTSCISRLSSLLIPPLMRRLRRMS